jgi:hypothetical protein
MFCGGGRLIPPSTTALTRPITSFGLRMLPRFMALRARLWHPVLAASRKPQKKHQQARRANLKRHRDRSKWTHNVIAIAKNHATRRAALAERTNLRQRVLALTRGGERPEWPLLEKKNTKAKYEFTCAG